MTIIIEIKVNRGDVLDRLDDRDCTLNEVGVALLRLKQIEKKLIDKEFKNKFEMEEKDE